MKFEVLNHRVENIGRVAGNVWSYLGQHGPVTLSKLARDLDVSRDLVMQAVGWLGREGKITFQQGARSKVISLT